MKVHGQVLKASKNQVDARGCPRWHAKWEKSIGLEVIAKQRSPLEYFGRKELSTKNAIIIYIM